MANTIHTPYTLLLTTYNLTIVPKNDSRCFLSEGIVVKVIKEAIELIKKVEFVGLATADATGKPNSAPKFFLKADDLSVYLIDYAIGRSAANIKANPRVSLSFVDMNSLVGYRLSGNARMVEKGQDYDDCIKELHEKKIDLTAKRVIEGVRKDKTVETYELSLSEDILIYKIDIEEGCGIGLSGEIERENVA